MANLEECQDRVLTILREAARAGERCPSNMQINVELRRRWGHGIQEMAQVGPMANLGLLRVEIYFANYRVVELDGVRTKRPDHSNPPWKVIDKRKGAR